DAFYLYQARWTATPVLHLTSSRFTRRTKATTPIKVYSNLPEAELFVNGVSRGLVKNDGSSILRWDDVRLSEGKNVIEVRGGSRSDSAVWELAREGRPHAPVDSAAHLSFSIGSASR